MFATATALSSFGGPSGSFPITIGRAASPYAQVTFDNLISKVAFNEPFFEPSLGQTQQVTAAFGANVDWTLQIIDENSNAVRRVTGSGTSLTFNWDGTGDGGTNIADGIYYYVISAQTNGMAFGASMESGDSLSLMAATAEDESIETWAVPADGGGDPVPFSIYPPGADTNNLVIFDAPRSEVYPRQAPLTGSFSAMSASGVGSFGPSGSGSSGSGSQTTTTPTRPPTAPVKNMVNNYGVAFFTWKTPQTNNIPKNGLPFPSTGVVHLDGCSSCNATISDSVEGHAENTAAGLVQRMKKLGWKLGFWKYDTDLSVNQLRRSAQGYGGSEIFTNVTVGVFMDHGSYGLDPDYSPGSSSSKQTYFRTLDSGDNGWLRMCQFGFGGNLKWMAFVVCDSLIDPNYNSMVSHGAIPLKETHLLCGASTVMWMDWDLGDYWANNMIKKNQKVVDAWFNAGHDAYARDSSITNAVTFRVTGYPECLDDKVNAYTDPSSPSPAPGNLSKRDFQVFP